MTSEICYKLTTFFLIRIIPAVIPSITLEIFWDTPVICGAGKPARWADLRFCKKIDKSQDTISCKTHLRKLGPYPGQFLPQKIPASTISTNDNYPSDNVHQQKI